MYPNFSIGIYGDWGTGKTTLMRFIYDQLKEYNKNNTLIPVWFNAWKYEREKHFALIPLLKTIEIAIPEEKYTNLKKALKEAAIFSIGISRDIISSTVSNYLGKQAGGLLNRGLKDLQQNNT